MAAHWAHERWRDFIELDGEEQSFIVAAYQSSNRIEAVLAYEQWRKSRPKNKGKI